MGLKQYTYTKILSSTSLPFLVLLVLAIKVEKLRLPSMILMAVLVAFTIIALIRSLRGMIPITENGITKDTDIYRDFVLGMRYGPVTVGNRYLYYMKNLSMQFIDADDIDCVYITNLTKIDYVQNGDEFRKRKRTSVYLTIEDLDGGEEKIRMKHETAVSALNAIRAKMPFVQIGYKKE